MAFSTQYIHIPPPFYIFSFYWGVVYTIFFFFFQKYRVEKLLQLQGKKKQINYNFVLF